MAIRRQTPKLLDQSRYARWVRASHCLDQIYPAVVPTLQGLGKIDAELCAEDAAFAERRDFASISRTQQVLFAMNESEALTDRLLLSALWLFGTYEVLRSFDEAATKNVALVHTNVHKKLKQVKHSFERPRILLAKQQPAWRHEQTDRAPAIPWFRGSSLAWRVAPRTIVSRRTLADSLIDFLEQIQNPRR